MNREDIISMAREAEFHPIAGGIVENNLLRFAAFVASAEREACIELVAFHGGPVDLEAAIRARGSRSE